MKLREALTDRLTGTTEQIILLKVVRSIDASTARSVGHAGLAYTLSSLSVAFADAADDSGNVTLAFLKTQNKFNVII